MADDEKLDIAQETHDIWRTYSNNRETWAQQAQEDKEFRLGRQWTKEQSDTLKARGQAPIVVNRIHPAVESAKAMITANRPSFRVAPREDSDNKTAQVLSALMSYMYDISDGRSVIRNVVDDYYVTGLGYIHVYQDPMMDMGKGEVCMHDVDPLDVYVDPNSRHRMFDDAENIIISRLYTRDQAKKIYPMYERAIDNAESDRLTDRPVTNRTDQIGLVFPEDTETSTESSTFGKNDEYIRGYERYYKKTVDKFRVFENFSGREDLLSEEEYVIYINRPAWLINGQIVTVEEQAQALIEQLQAELVIQYEEHVRSNQLQGDDLPEPPKVDV